MNRIRLSGLVYAEPTHAVKNGSDVLKILLNTGYDSIAEVVPEIIRRGVPCELNNARVYAYGDMASEWWGNISEGDRISVEGRIDVAYGYKWAYIMPRKIEVVESAPDMNFAEVSGSVFRDDKIVYCWDKDGVMHEEMLPESEIVAIEHPFMIRTDDKPRSRLIKVKTYGENAYRALTHSAGNVVKRIRGPLHFWMSYAQGARAYADYAILAKEIYYGEDRYDAE